MMTTDNPYEGVWDNLGEIMGGSFSRALPTIRTDELDMRSSVYVLAMREPVKVMEPRGIFP